MRKKVGLSSPLAALLCASVCILGATSEVRADSQVTGYVYDLTGQPLSQAMVSVRNGKNRGADIVTVFADSEGKFRFPASIGGLADPEQQITARILGYEQTRVTSAGTDPPKFTVIMRKIANYANTAPASAWLANIDPANKEILVKSCVGCHQIPAPEVRAYAKQIAEVPSSDPESVRKASWTALVKYMNWVAAGEFSRGTVTAEVMKGRGVTAPSSVPQSSAPQSSAPPPGAERAYSVGNGDEVASILYHNFTGPLQVLEHYDYGAPLAVTPDTVIREYEVPLPNTIREAVMMGTPPKLWASDSSSNRMIAIDIDTGKQEVHEVPTDKVMGPHTLVRGSDGSLWITPLFSSVLAHLDADEKTWHTWETKTQKGDPVQIHDISFGYKHELLTDNKGRIWFSDIGNNALGYLDPKTGVVEDFKAPPVAGRTNLYAGLYGLVMTSDRKHLWYSQVNIGSFGSFNIDTLKFEKLVVLPTVKAGPRRLTIDDKDIMYVPLYGAGQLMEYDTRAGKPMGVFDLPDRASAPYSATWDPKRRVVWIVTSNADVIYRFDPASKQFSVLPLPRTGAFLRMVDVDPKTGLLTTSYANLVEFVRGPRMALIIDPGDRTNGKAKKASSKMIPAAKE